LAHLAAISITEATQSCIKSSINQVKITKSFAFRTAMKFVIIALAFIGVSLGCSSNNTVVVIKPEDGIHWQGDIALTPEQQLILEGGGRSSNTGLLYLASRWPKSFGTVLVPYTIEAGQYCEFNFLLKYS
jgi:hypothetical protein